MVDNIAGHVLLSFMDGFSGYNQVKMALEDMEKTSLITPRGTYCYKVTPFGLKNAGATYQRAATTLLHDLIRKEVEVYESSYRPHMNAHMLSRKIMRQGYY